MRIKLAVGCNSIDHGVWGLNLGKCGWSLLENLCICRQFVWEPFLSEVFGALPWISLCVFLEMQVDLERDYCAYEVN